MIAATPAATETDDRQDVVGEQRDAGDLRGQQPKLSFVTMYAPPALGYALIVWRYENSRIAEDREDPERDRHDEREGEHADRRDRDAVRISSVA